MPKQEPTPTVIGLATTKHMECSEYEGPRIEDIRRLVGKAQNDRAGSDETPAKGVNALASLVESPALDALTGTVLEQRYCLGRVLGSGGMGAVFEARHLLLDRPVAIKVLRPKFAAESEYVERFIREAKMASKIRHRNVVEILDYGQTTNGLAYSVMEFLEGQDLQQLLQEQPQGRLPWTMVHGLLLQIASGLRAAHGQGVIHRDIKPANCFLTNEDGERVVKLLDFGIAKLERGQGPTLTGAAQLMGTPGYIAPELVRAHQPASPQSDIYALGVVAYRMLAGRLPFSGDTTFEMVRKACYDPVPSLQAQVPGLPAQVETFVLELLAREAEQRPANMGMVRDALVKLGLATLRPRAGAFFESSVLLSDDEPIQRTEKAMSALRPFAPSVEATTPQETGLPERVRGRTAPSLAAAASVIAVLGALVASVVLLGDDGPQQPPETAAVELIESIQAEPIAVEPIAVEPIAVEPIAVEPIEPGSATDVGVGAPLIDEVEPVPEQQGSSGVEEGIPIEALPPPSPKRRKAKAVEQPPTDSVLIDRLKRKITRMCAQELRTGPVTVKFLVTTAGRIVGLTATGKAETCARAQVQDAKFRARSVSAPFKLTVK